MLIPLQNYSHRKGLEPDQAKELEEFILDYFSLEVGHTSLVCHKVKVHPSSKLHDASHSHGEKSWLI